DTNEISSEELKVAKEGENNKDHTGRTVDGVTAALERDAAKEMLTPKAAEARLATTESNES
nr:hypothetical protein [Tanacetum cinerariifolium]